MSQNERDKGIVRGGIVGIVGNLVLTAFKLLVGILAGSIAIILDAVNNASDAISSIITIVGIKLSRLRPDRAHPFGYGRIEYISSVAIALIILAAGVLSAKESIEKIIHPADPDYTTLTVSVIIASILAKIFIGIYLKRAGKKYDSQALIASAVDSNYDAVVSFGTLVAAFAMMLFRINIDGIVGLIISVFVLKAGFDILKDALNPIIGEGVNDQLGRDIKSYVTSFDDVLGAYDLIIDNFGPNELIGSIHIEVEDDMTAKRIHELTHEISEGVYDRFHIIMTIGIYASNTTGNYKAIRDSLQEIAAAHPEVLEVHGFYVDESKNTINFDLVIDFKCDEATVYEDVINKMKDKYPDYTFDAIIDMDYLE